MTIVFICGSLEYGKDGVGDYTRRLAITLTSFGHNCFILAIMDKFVNAIVLDNIYTNNLKIPCMRLPFSTGYIENCKLSKPWLNNLNPDLIILQYVPFAYQNKGLPLQFTKGLKNLIGKATFAIMFHELWVGMNKEATFKLKVLGFFQKLLIRVMINKLNPTLIFTQALLYKMQLQKMGYKIQLLPLISNIPSVCEFVKPLNTITFVIFGGIHENSPIDDFVNELSLYLSKNKQLDIEIVFIGKTSVHHELWQSIFVKNGFVVNILGELDEYSISKELGRSTFGLTSTAYILLDKSGSVAAMKEHNLPIICLSKPWSITEVNEIKFEESILEFSKGNLDQFIEKFRTKKIPYPEVDILGQFLEILNK